MHIRATLLSIFTGRGIVTDTLRYDFVQFQRFDVIRFVASWLTVPEFRLQKTEHSRRIARSEPWPPSTMTVLLFALLEMTGLRRPKQEVVCYLTSTKRTDVFAFGPRRPLTDGWLASLLSSIDWYGTWIWILAMWSPSESCAFRCNENKFVCKVDSRGLDTSSRWWLRRFPTNIFLAKPPLGGDA